MPQPLKILIVEDQPDDAELLVAELRRAGFDPQWQRVETEPAFLAGIRAGPDLILSDYSLPQFSGLRAAELLRASELNIPFILISGTVGEDVAVEAMKRGATDYLIKDRIARLGTAVKNALTQKQLVMERRRAETSLSLFRALLDRSSDGIEVVDMETGALLDVNETTCERLGYPRAELLGMKVWELYTQEMNPALWAQKISALRQAGAKVVEGESRRKDGSTFPVEISVRHVKLEREYLIASVRDITERLLAQKQVRQLSHAVEQSPAAVVITDTRGHIEYVNRKFTEVTGYTLAEVLGKNPRLLKSGDMPPETYQALWRTIRAGGTWTGELHNRKKNGELHWEWASISPILDERGQPAHYLAVKEDRTERRRAETALRESEEKFRQITETINEVFWITEQPGDRMIYVSPAYEKIWGRTCASLYQSPATWAEAIHPDDRDRVVHASATGLPRGEYDETYRVVRPDGSVRWIHDQAFPVRNAAGAIHRVVGTAEDITEHRKLEAQFRQAQKMESIGQLAGGIAHDFNNILSAIVGHLYLARQEAADRPALQENLDHIAAATRRATDLVSQILTFSRRKESERSAIKLNNIVLEALKLLRASMPSTIRIQTGLAETPAVLANPTAIHQIIMNLGTNALHAMRAEPGTLQIELEVEELKADFAASHPGLHPGRHVRLSVGDSGCGMDAATLEHIFDPFFTTKAVGEGTGLGLAVVHGIMESHGGSVVVHSQPGQGTVFHLYFPVIDGPEDVTAGQAEVTPVSRGRGERILYVDDEEVLARVGKRTLEGLGYVVTAKTAALDALAAIRDQPGAFDLVITDLTMPVMDGLRLGTQMLQLQPGLPIILMTGYSGDITLEKVCALGFSQLLEKPCTARTLAEAVHQVLLQPRRA
jgi:PAS domain S-box-containing protein